MKTWLRLLLVTITVGGGFSGVAITLQALGSGTSGVLQAIIVSLFLGLYAFVTISGLLFVNDVNCRRPVIVALALQIPWFSCPVLVYQFAAGLLAALALGSPKQNAQPAFHFAWNLFLGAHFAFRFGTNLDVPWAFGVNTIPIILLVLMRQAKHSSLGEQQPATTDTSH